MLSDQTKENIGILMIHETKIHDRFSESQFKINGFKTRFLVDRNLKWGAIINVGCKGRFTNKASDWDTCHKFERKHSLVLQNIFMHSLMRQLNQKSRLFWLKLPNIMTVFKKRSKNQKANYRSVSILPTISKIFENILNK